MKLGLYGGSFDPPHLGHLAAADFFQKALALDEVRILPAGEAPLKSLRRQSCGAARMALCRSTFPFPVSGMELARPGTSYTVDTLRTLADELPQAELYLLIGTDQLGQLRRWHRWEEILQRCKVCALPRDSEEIVTDLPVTLLKGFVPVEISATRIRQGIALGEDVSHWLAPAAHAYIKEKELYHISEAPANASLRELLDPKRLHHSFCVAEAAEALALRYGADPALAWTAGLWHDCAKEQSFAEQAALCAAYEKPFGQAERQVPQICHAFAGEAYLALERGITNEEVLGAVRWHSTGHAGMTLLEEIIFVADLVSAERDYPDVAITRSLAVKNLHAASKYILEFIIKKCQKTGAPLHPDSLAWYNELGGFSLYAAD